MKNTALSEQLKKNFTLVGSFEPYITDMKDRYHYNQATYNTVGKTVGENIAKYYN